MYNFLDGILIKVRWKKIIIKCKPLCNISRSTILAAVKNVVKKYKPRLIMARVR